MTPTPTSGQPFPDRIAQLRRRWDADRSSRLFLQLAEEYRHQGQLRESLEVLDAGLAEHPGYLSALVAKGRCLLEVGEPQAAREALERVVGQDGTQAVASKLLVRAYLELGEVERARQRLSLYALLHENDPDVADLRRRLTAPEPPSARVAEVPVVEREELDRVIHREVEAEANAPAAPARSDLMNPDIFDLGPPSPLPTRPTAVGEDLFGLFTEPSPAPPAADEPLGLDDLIFPGLGNRESRRRWEESLVGGGIFDLGDPAVEHVADVRSRYSPIAAPDSPRPAVGLAASPLAMPEAPAAFEAAAPVGQPPVDPKLLPRLVLPLAKEPEQTVDEAPPAPVVPEVREQVATVTLAELYLRQGHREEALRILGDVLQSDPGNAAAEQLLARLAPPAEPEPEPQVAPAPVFAFESAVPDVSAATPEAMDFRVDVAPPLEPEVVAPSPVELEAFAATELPHAESAPTIEPAVDLVAADAAIESSPIELPPIDSLAVEPVAAGEPGPADRKIQLLNAYLRRLRRGRGSDVS